MNRMTGLAALVLGALVVVGNAQVWLLRADIRRLTQDSGPQTSTADEVPMYTAQEAEVVVSGLGDAPQARRLSEVLSELESRVVRPEEEARFLKVKEQLISDLRKQVKQEVKDLQKAALEADSGDEALRSYTDAGQILSLYPMSQDAAVLEEAKTLSAEQTEVANRLELIRRQRYNQWATAQIEAAIDGYNKGSSYWSPKKENQRLMESLVKSLGEVDPALLEPVVIELYNYVIDLTKGSISEAEKVQLAKQLTDPKIQRKTLGDF